MVSASPPRTTSPNCGATSRPVQLRARHSASKRVRGVCSEWRFGLGLIVVGVLSALFFDRLFDYLIGQ